MATEQMIIPLLAPKPRDVWHYTSFYDPHAQDVYISCGHDIYFRTGIRVGFFPSTYHVSEAAGNVSVCAKVYDYAGIIQNTEVGLMTISSTGKRAPPCLLNLIVIVTIYRGKITL